MQSHFHTLLTLSLLVSPVIASEESENASNPLAKVKNTDLRLQGFDVTAGDFYQASLEGAFMARDDLKLKYELHYQQNDFSGQSEQHLESALAKAIWFAKEGKTENYGYRLALGLDWQVDLGDKAKSIGTGSDTLAPFIGYAMSLNNGVSVIPLLQHYMEYSGNPVNTTAARIIAMKPLANNQWLKLDAKIPYDWENDGQVPANMELQYGKTLTKGFGIYGDLFVGLGQDRPYDWGLGAGVRFSY